MKTYLPASLAAGADQAASPRLQLARSVAAAVFMVGLTAAFAHITVSVPGAHVPFTMQPAVVLLSGLVLGPRLGCFSQLLYLAAGVAGLPVFAASPTLPPGAARLAGPTAGYLLAYPLAAFIVGAIAGEAHRGLLVRFMAMAVGVLTYFAAGVVWLAAYIAPGTSQPLGLELALAHGMYPFVVWDLLKGILVALVAPRLFWIDGGMWSRHQP